MTQLEHFMYLRILYQETVDGGAFLSLIQLREEIGAYCEKFNADYGRTVILL